MSAFLYNSLCFTAHVIFLNFRMHLSDLLSWVVALVLPPERCVQ